MTLKNDQELANTREKLRMLEEAYREACNDTSEGQHVRELSMRSLRRLINEMQEEIARYKVHQIAGGKM